MSGHFYTESHQSSVGRLIPDLIRARELLIDLVIKGLKIRYRIAALGFFWAVLHPLLMMAVLTIVFGFVLGNKLGLADPSRPYHVVILSGVILWQFAASSLLQGTMSLVANRDLIKKVYFPREVIPIATILDWAINFFVGLVLLFIVHLISGGQLGPGIGWIALLIAIETAMLLGLALIFSVANAYYRDVQYIVEVAISFGFYATPIFYEIDQIGQSQYGWLKTLILINPMSGLVTAFRDVLFTGSLAHPLLLIWPGIFALAALTLGAFYFRRSAGTLADNL